MGVITVSPDRIELVGGPSDSQESPLQERFVGELVSDPHAALRPLALARQCGTLLFDLYGEKAEERAETLYKEGMVEILGRLGWPASMDMIDRLDGDDDYQIALDGELDTLYVAPEQGLTLEEVQVIAPLITHVQTAIRKKISNIHDIGKLAKIFSGTFPFFSIHKMPLDPTVVSIKPDDYMLMLQLDGTSILDQARSGGIQGFEVALALHGSGGVLSEVVCQRLVSDDELVVSVLNPDGYRSDLCIDPHQVSRWYQPLMRL